jgi:6,7-dimethyl-8-ribityllumazine synthase
MKKILIIQAIFYEEISTKLLEGAAKKIAENGLNYDVVNVSGALEIPAIIAIAKDLNLYDGFVALGCVIRGETSHYEIVSFESARGLNQLAIEHKLAIGNGIITVENEQQAYERADCEKLNKGGFAVDACLEVIKFKEKLLKKN